MSRFAQLDRGRSRTRPRCRGPTGHGAGPAWLAKVVGMGKPQQTCANGQGGANDTQAPLGHHQCRRAAHNQRQGRINEQQDSTDQGPGMRLSKPHQISPRDLVSSGRIGSLSGCGDPHETLKRQKVLRVVQGVRASGREAPIADVTRSCWARQLRASQVTGPTPQLAGGGVVDRWRRR